MPRPKKKLSESPKWRQTPEWRRQVRDVLMLVEKGFNSDKIHAITQIEHTVVKRIIEEEEHNNEVIRKNWGEKVPVMRDIIGMGLNGMKETLKEMVDPDVRRRMIKGVSDMAALTKIIESLNTLVRLETGESTSNIAVQHKHTYQETRGVLQELSKIDPVFDYHVALPEPEAGIALEPVVIDGELELVELKAVEAIELKAIEVKVDRQE